MPIEFVPAESPLKTRHREKIDMAADRMYDAIRTFLAAPNNEAALVAETGLKVAADNYDASISSGDLETDDATAP